MDNLALQLHSVSASRRAVARKWYRVCMQTAPRFVGGAGPCTQGVRWLRCSGDPRE